MRGSESLRSELQALSDDFIQSQILYYRQNGGSYWDPTRRLANDLLGEYQLEWNRRHPDPLPPVISKLTCKYCGAVRIRRLGEIIDKTRCTSCHSLAFGLLEEWNA